MTQRLTTALLAQLALLGLALGLPGLSSAARPAAAPLQATVIRVIDGDSLLLRTAPDAPPLELRLQGIDAPEGCQPGGDASREALAAYVQDKTLAVETTGRDSYGRTLGKVRVDGLDINQRMVAEGQAWSIRSQWNRGPYVAQEKMAQALKRGLHATPGGEAPWDFRRRHGPCQGAPASAPAAGPKAPATSVAPGDVLAGSPTAAGGSAFRCDGRTRCTQMRSCAEATFFLRHCPGTQMDGDGDGVPCESQWCR